MSLEFEKADAFLEDFAVQALWYVREASGDLAREFQQAVDSQLQLLCQQPDLGKRRRFKHPKLHGLRSLAIKRPFHRFLIFYQHDGVKIRAVRLMDGARDLPRRLKETGSERST